MLRDIPEKGEFLDALEENIIAVKLDIWLATFAVGMLIASGSSYRERALLPFEGEGDTGFLGREVGESGLTNLVSLDEQNPSRFIPGLIPRGNGAPNAFRRNISPRSGGGPLTSSANGTPIAAPALDNQGSSGSGSSSGVQPGFVDSGGSNGGSAGGAGTGPTGNIGSGSVGFGNVGGSPITTVGLLSPNDSTPTTPGTGTPGIVVPAIPPISSPVPEPGIWMLFLLGLFASGGALRRQKRQSVAVHQQRAAATDSVKPHNGLL